MSDSLGSALSPKPLSSLIILTYNNLDVTRQCLESIYACTPLADFELIVVDNASSDGTPVFLQDQSQRYANLYPILNEKNLGFAGGNNQGAENARGEYLVFLNNDVVVTSGWLAALVSHLQDDRVGMVGPVTNASGNETRIRVDYQGIDGLQAFALNYTQAHRGQAFEIDMLPFQCVAMRRSLWARVGNLDEQFGVGMFEDDDYALRVHQAGYKILCAEDVFIHHWGSSSFSKLGIAGYWSLFIENRRKFEEKWGRTWTPHLVRPELLPEQSRQNVEDIIYFGKLVVDMEQALQQRLQAQIDLVERLEQVGRELAERDRFIQAQVQRHSEEMSSLQLRYDQDVSYLNGQLQGILASRTYRMALRFQRLRHLLLPEGGRRARLAQFTFHLLRLLFAQGIVAFCRELFTTTFRHQPFSLLTRFMDRLRTPAAHDFGHAYGIHTESPDRTQVFLYTDENILPSYPHRRPLSPKEPGDQPAMLPPSINLQVSLIATIRNEAGNVSAWLHSILDQSRLPDEIVITDGGSTDGTPDIIRQLIPGFPIPVQFIEAPGANISQGRNLAIRHASFALVACSDCGSILDPDWLKNLLAPFANNDPIDASMGYFKPVIKAGIDRLVASYFLADLEAVDPQYFLPSGRSLVIQKTLWARAGGYPEWLSDAGEDTYFDTQAKTQPGNWAFVPKAWVAWRAPHTLNRFYKTVYRYSKGEGEAGLFGPNYQEKRLATAWFVGVWGVLGLVSLFSLIFLPGLWKLPVPALVLAQAAWTLIQRTRSLSRRLKLGFSTAALDAFYFPVFMIAQLRGFKAGVLGRPAAAQRREAQYRRQLEEILAQYPDRRGIIIYPATHDWGFMFQRPHQIARAFSRQGYLYFYGTNNDKTDSVVGFQMVEPGLYLCNVPNRVFSGLHSPLVYIGASWHAGLLSDFDEPQVIYDHYDDLEVSAGRVEDHQALLKAAQVVVVTSRVLEQKIKPQRPDVILAPNGVDFEFIQGCRPTPDQPPPSDWAPVQRGGCPIIGYSGALAEWFDYELLAYLAQSRPEWQFALIGVNYDGSLERSGVLKLSNVAWLGMKPYAELFHYIWQFDVGTIPFKINNITLATSPIKQFEYMACAKPVVSTALPECKHYPAILVSESYAQFLANLERALGLKSEEPYIHLLEQTARENTWNQRVFSILQALKQKP